MLPRLGAGLGARARALASPLRASRSFGTQGLLGQRRLFSAEAAPQAPAKAKSWLYSAEWWGFAGAMAGWGMSISGFYDAYYGDPEKISLNMTPVLIVYSSLFCRWAFVVQPQNLLLAACHGCNVIAQSYKLQTKCAHMIKNGEGEVVKDMGMKAGVGAAALAVMTLAAPTMRTAIGGAGLGVVSTIAAADAGPFTVHFWAPMSKWLISGANLVDLNKPVEKISVATSSALTLTGFFFMRYALLVTPINYVLCSVNVALFGSSAVHVARKVKADYF